MVNEVAKPKRVVWRVRTVNLAVGDLIVKEVLRQVGPWEILELDRQINRKDGRSAGYWHIGVRDMQSKRHELRCRSNDWWTVLRIEGVGRVPAVPTRSQEDRMTDEQEQETGGGDVAAPDVQVNVDESTAAAPDANTTDAPPADDAGESKSDEG